jgi:hypothetical protein
MPYCACLHDAVSYRGKLIEKDTARCESHAHKVAAWRPSR